MKGWYESTAQGPEGTGLWCPGSQGCLVPQIPLSPGNPHKSQVYLMVNRAWSS